MQLFKTATQSRREKNSIASNPNDTPTHFLHQITRALFSVPHHIMHKIIPTHSHGIMPKYQVIHFYPQDQKPLYIVVVYNYPHFI